MFKFCSSNKTKLYVLMQIVCIKGCAVFVQLQPRQQFLSHTAELHYSPLFFLSCSDSSPDEVNLGIWVINQGTLVCPLDNNSYSAIICWIRLVTCTSGEPWICSTFWSQRYIRGKRVRRGSCWLVTVFYFLEEERGEVREDGKCERKSCKMLDFIVYEMHRSQTGLLIKF